MLLSFLQGGLNRREEVIDQELEDMKERERYIREMLPQVRARSDKHRQAAIDYNSRLEAAGKVYGVPDSAKHLYARDTNMQLSELLNWSHTDVKQKTLAEQTAKNLTPPSLSQVGQVTQASANPEEVQPNIPQPGLSPAAQPGQDAPGVVPSWVTQPLDPNARPSMLDILFGRIPDAMKVNTIYSRLGKDTGIAPDVLQSQMASYATGDGMFEPPKMPEGDVQFRLQPHELAAKVSQLMEGEYSNPGLAYKYFYEGVRDGNEQSIMKGAALSLSANQKAEIEHRFRNMPGAFTENQITKNIGDNVKTLFGASPISKDINGDIILGFGENDPNAARSLLAEGISNTMLSEWKPNRKDVSRADVVPVSIAGALQVIKSEISLLEGADAVKNKDSIARLKDTQKRLTTQLKNMGVAGERFTSIVEAANLAAANPGGTNEAPIVDQAKLSEITAAYEANDAPTFNRLFTENPAEAAEFEKLRTKK